MKNPIPTGAAVAALILPLAVGALLAGPAGREGRLYPTQCLSVDLALVRTASGPEARLAVRWACREADLQASLSIERNGIPIPGARAWVEGIREAELQAPLQPAQVEASFELCGRINGVAVLADDYVEVAARRCEIIRLPVAGYEPDLETPSRWLPPEPVAP